MRSAHDPGLNTATIALCCVGGSVGGEITVLANNASTAKAPSR